MLTSSPNQITNASAGTTITITAYLSSKAAAKQAGAKATATVAEAAAPEAAAAAVAPTPWRTSPMRRRRRPHDAPRQVAFLPPRLPNAVKNKVSSPALISAMWTASAPPGQSTSSGTRPRSLRGGIGARAAGCFRCPPECLNPETPPTPNSLLLYVLLLLSPHPLSPTVGGDHYRRTRPGSHGWQNGGNAECQR
jgi:hypothetical protein